jgi:hypothetical protein
LVRKTVEPPTATLLAISSSLAPASAASKICRALELARGILAAAEKGLEFIAFGLVEFDPMTYIHPCLLLAGGADEQLNRMAGVSASAKTFTPTHGQYLAYIHLYTRLHRRPPAEADIQQYFCVTPPSVRQMVLTLERAGFIRRKPGVARSIEVLVDPKLLPELL